MRLNSYIQAFGIYCLLFFLTVYPYWMNLEVISPHTQSIELGLQSEKSKYIENRKFNDFFSVYLPEIHALQSGSQSGWLKLWNEENELGRPAYHISGLSPAYPLSYIIQLFTSSPFRVITILSLLICFLAGVFIFGLCYELRYLPLVGTITAASVAISPIFMYWLTFPMFLASWCWSAGFAYSSIRLTRKQSLWAWSVLVFSVYSLLMTAYPQLVIFHIYLLLAHTLWLSRQHQKNSSSFSLFRYISLIILGVGIGVVLALPTYLDLVYTTSESARTDPSMSFFTKLLPVVDSWESAIQLFSLSLFPELFGNPIDSSYPFNYDALSLPAIMLWGIVFGSMSNFRRMWGWWLAVFILVLLTFYYPFYVFSVQYLGLGLSRSHPFYILPLPLTFIFSDSIHSFLACRKKRPYNRLACFSSVLCGLFLSISIIFSLKNGYAIQWDVCFWFVFMFSILAIPLPKFRATPLLVVLVVSSIHFSFPLMLRQNPRQILTDSPLTEAVRANMPKHARFAISSPGLGVLPPNVNASLELNSVHTYNSLSSRRYHQLIESLGGTMVTYGRWNTAIAPDYNSSMFWMSNIALMLSPTPLNHPNLEAIDKIGDVYLQRVKSHMGETLQISLMKEQVSTDPLNPIDPRQLVSDVATRELDQGDRLTFSTQAKTNETLLLLSQKFHRDWQAQALTSSGWQVAEIIPVNGVFQGVWLPAGTQKVDLRFLPWVRFAWIAHLFWSMILSVIAYQCWRTRQRAHASQGGLKNGRV